MRLLKVVILKVFPPFVVGSNRSVEKKYSIADEAKLIDLLMMARDDNILLLDKVVSLEDREIREGVVVLVNGRTVFDMDYMLSNGDRIAILPLAPGG